MDRAAVLFLILSKDLPKKIALKQQSDGHRISAKQSPHPKNVSEEVIDIPKETWPICAICHKPVEDFKHFVDVFEDKQGRKINSFVAFCHGDRQQAIYVAGQAPPLKFGPAFSGISFLT